jgi:hypothetical protein
MKIFFDTEFTSITSQQRGLISIGCVTQFGKQFYAELTDTWDECMCSIFTIETVLPLLQGGTYSMSVSELSDRLKEWIEGFNEQVTFYSDAPVFDWPFIKEIFDYHGWPRNLNRECGVIQFNNQSAQDLFSKACEDYWRVPVHAPWRHHSLIDAQSLAFASWHANANTMPVAEFNELMSIISLWSVQDGDTGYIYWNAVLSNLKELRALPVNELGSS